MKKKIINKIINIQEKPEEDKMRIVWILSIFFMIFIIGIWFSSFKHNKQIASNNFNQIKLLPFPDIETELDDLDVALGNIDNIKTEIINENEQIKIEEIAKLYIEEELSEEIYNNLKIKQIEKQEDNWSLEYQQYYQDVLIEENKTLFTINNTNGKVSNFISNYDENIAIDIIPTVGIEEVNDIISAELKNDKLEFKDSSLVIYKNILINPTKYHLSWKINVISEPFQNDYYYIDAQNGKVLYYYNLNK